MAQSSVGASPERTRSARGSAAVGDLKGTGETTAVHLHYTGHKGERVVVASSIGADREDMRYFVLTNLVLMLRDDTDFRGKDPRAVMFPRIEEGVYAWKGRSLVVAGEPVALDVLEIGRRWAAVGESAGTLRSDSMRRTIRLSGSLWYRSLHDRYVPIPVVPQQHVVHAPTEAEHPGGRANSPSTSAMSIPGSRSCLRAPISRLRRPGALRGRSGLRERRREARQRSLRTSLGAPSPTSASLRTQRRPKPDGVGQGPVPTISARSLTDKRRTSRPISPEKPW